MTETKRIVHLNFKAYFDDTSELYETNIEECAKENNLYNEKATYAPIAYIVGSKTFYDEVDEILKTAEVGKEFEVTVPCEKAAGVRNPKLIEMYPIKEFYKAEINPVPGMAVTLGNRSGVVRSAGAGRVKVDFNDPRAGHDLTFKITVIDEITDPIEKAKAVMEADFGISEGFGFGIMEDRVVITEADVCKFHESWPIAKYRLVSSYRGIFGVDRIEFVQVWESAKKAETPEKTEEEAKTEE